MTTRTARGLFVVYLVLLVWAILWKLEAPWTIQSGERVVKLVPFVATGCAGASTSFDVVVNVLLFVPFGLYLGLLTSWSWRRSGATMAAASVALEITQYVLAVGSADVTDVLTNTAGGLAGFGLFALARRRLQARTVPVMTRLCAIGSVLAVLACAIVVATPLSFGPPKDYWAPGSGLRPPLPCADHASGEPCRRDGSAQTCGGPGAEPVNVAASEQENEEVVPVNAGTTWVLPSRAMVGR